MARNLPHRSVNFYLRHTVYEAWRMAFALDSLNEHDTECLMKHRICGTVVSQKNAFTREARIDAKNVFIYKYALVC